MSHIDWNRSTFETDKKKRRDVLAKRRQCFETKRKKVIRRSEYQWKRTTGKSHFMKKVASELRMQNDNEMNLIRWSKIGDELWALINWKYVKMIWNIDIIWFMEFPVPSAGKVTQNFINLIQWTMRRSEQKLTQRRTYILIDSECEFLYLFLIFEIKTPNRSHNESNQLSAIKSAKIKLSWYNDFLNNNNKKTIEREMK